ncbi:hypothetical protein TNCV_1130041 [Trichonephila clavipes]|nr:hypothetical protein TNCV_1130041 [Trichonephila clavipes]
MTTNYSFSVVSADIIAQSASSCSLHIGCAFLIMAPPLATIPVRTMTDKKAQPLLDPLNSLTKNGRTSRDIILGSLSPTRKSFFGKEIL